MPEEAAPWTSIAIAILISILYGATTTLISTCETEGLWTVRLRLSLYEHIWKTVIATTLAASFGSVVRSFLRGKAAESLGLVLLYSATSLMVFRFVWPAWRNCDYYRNRWLAWAGPSRTGIAGTYVPYIGGPQDWRFLENNVHVMQRHPVEAWLYRRSQSELIMSDPTDLLKAAHAAARQTTEFKPSASFIPLSMNETTSSLIGRGVQMTGAQDVFPVFSSKSPRLHEITSGYTSETPKEKCSIAQGLFAPVIPGQSASLLWGSKLGFRPRVSRGILSAPYRLLTANPRTADDHDGRALCIAHGILARNKGLNPSSFILQLDKKQLEENSVQWPRPSKVLRSYYAKEMQDMYSGLGDSYVECATELALILADTHPTVIRDWLEANLEHQDIGLNRRAAELGASDDDLQILYRLSYAAMLVSLSSHACGHRLRPEMTIFHAYVTHVEARPSGLPTWAIGKEMQSRLEQEQKVDSRSDLNALIEAVLPPRQGFD